MLEHIIAGILIILFFLMCIFLPRILINLSIKIVERIKPGIWYNRPIEKNVNTRTNMIFFWAIILFMAGAYFGMLYAYPFLISLCK